MSVSVCVCVREREISVSVSEREITKERERVFSQLIETGHGSNILGRSVHRQIGT